MFELYYSIHSYVLKSHLKRNRLNTTLLRSLVFWQTDFVSFWYLWTILGTSLYTSDGWRINWCPALEIWSLRLGLSVCEMHEKPLSGNMRVTGVLVLKSGVEM